MVQKISKYNTLTLSRNFDFQGSTGLNFNHGPGAVTGVGVIKESAAGSVAVPASGSWDVYADFVTGNLAAAATAPLTNSQVLYQGTSGGGVITSVTDVRSWTSSGINVGSRGFDEFLTTVAAPNRSGDWLFDEVSPNAIINQGTATQADLNAIGAAVTYSATGDVAYETDDALSFPGAGGNWAARTAGLTPASYPAHSTGSFGIVAKADGTQSGPILFAVGSSSTTDFTFFRTQGGAGATGNMEVHFVSSGGSNDALTRSTSTLTIYDNNYHMFIYTQSGTGIGPQLYFDGALVAQGTTNYTGTRDADSWFHDKPTQGRIAFASATALGNNLYGGDIARAWVSTDVMTAGNIATLNTARTQLV